MAGPYKNCRKLAKQQAFLLLLIRILTDLLLLVSSQIGHLHRQCPNDCIVTTCSNYPAQVLPPRPPTKKELQPSTQSVCKCQQLASNSCFSTLEVCLPERQVGCGEFRRGAGDGAGGSAGLVLCAGRVKTVKNNTTIPQDHLQSRPFAIANVTSKHLLNPGHSAFALLLHCWQKREWGGEGKSSDLQLVIQQL